MSNKTNNALAIINKEADEFSVKKALYNLANSTSLKFSSMVNKEFAIKFVTFTPVEVTDKDTGVVETKERALVVDSEGTIYHTFSNGLLNSLHTLCALFASEKDNFFIMEHELNCTLVEKDTKNGHTYIIELV